jgi:hypothetical protein
MRVDPLGLKNERWIAADRKPRSDDRGYYLSGLRPWPKKMRHGPA